MSLRRTILLFALLVLVFDGVWLTLPRLSGAHWAGSGLLATLLTVTIYALAGLVAGRNGSISDGATAGLTVGAIDATLGGVLAALLGGTSLGGLARWAAIILSAIVGVALGGLFGTIGAAIARLPGIAPRLESDDVTP
jgi:hypothetical protein